MIITELKGGLGNQLFQYSVGRALAEKSMTQLKLDTSWYGVVPDRQYDLHYFAISGEVATHKEIRRLKGGFGAKISGLLGKPATRSVITEQFFHFDPDILELGDNVYLDGYWQSPKYFESIASTIRKEFSLKDEPKGQNKHYAESISNTAAVSLHVRRGDYVANKKFNDFHGTSPLAYYAAAVAYIAKKVQSPHFFIFSDDPQWTKENLKFDYPTTYITGNEKAGQEDLRLMSMCKHFIVANSTFSWWGAWLGGNKNKIIIAPKEWFKDKAQDTKDLIPESWVRL